MKGIVSALGLGQLGVLLGGFMLLGGHAGLAVTLINSAYQASTSLRTIGAQSIVQSALNIVIHLSTTSNPAVGGAAFTLYNKNDGIADPFPGFDQQKLLHYWQQDQVQLNNLQCAGFVATALYMSGHPMVHTIGLASSYWNNSQGAFPLSSWQYILPASGGNPPGGIQTIKSAPQPGDIVVFSNPKDPAGHVAIVIAINPPTNGQGNGNMVLAQANFPPNYYTLDQARSTWTSTDPMQSNPVPWITTKDIPLYVAPRLADGDINLPGHPLLGYIRNIAAQQSAMPTTGGAGSASKLPASPWVQTAVSDAVANGLNPTWFTAQINQESGFNTTVVSSTGAIGIAQFEPGTAQSWGVDPHDPASSLAGAARMMASYYQKYLVTSSGPVEAYAKALAAYNCGEGCLQNTVSHYGTDWLNHLPPDQRGLPQTRDYIRAILGI